MSSRTASGNTREQPDTQERLLPRLRAAMQALSRKATARAELLSVVVIVGIAFGMLLNVVVNAQVLSITDPNVSVRVVGDPDRARERIVSENFTTLQHLDSLANNPDTPELERLVFEHTPLILRYTAQFPERYNSPIGVYYDVSQSSSGEAVATTIRYYLWFVDEEGGMPIESRLSMFGHSLDRELVYRVTLLGDQVVAAYFQAPGHRHVNMDYTGESRPVFAVASANHNFRYVTVRELDFPREKILLVPLPHRESPWRPAHDPDFMALAASEVWEKYGIDVRNFVFVEFQMPAVPTVLTVSILVGERWHYLHEQIGGGVSRPGYNQVGINVGYPILPGDIRELRIVAYSSVPSSFEPIRLTIYPRSSVPA